MLSEEYLSVSTELPPNAGLYSLLYGHRASQAVFVFSKLGLADLLRKGPQHYSDLAKATKSHPPSLFRLLRYLTSLGVIAENKNGTFALTAVGHQLVNGAPDSLSAFSRFFSQPWFQKPWENLLHSVLTGETAFDYVHGMNLFQYLKNDPEAATFFNGAMTEGSTQTSTATTAAYDFSQFKTIVDIGGGHGTLLSSILTANSSLRGILYDLNGVIQGAKKQMEAKGLADRCECVAGDFFREVPSGFEAYMLRQIIHDWDDERSIQILTNIRRAILPEGKLLILEMLLPSETDSSPLAQLAAARDLNMMVITGGQERTKSEYHALLDSAGFKLTRVIPANPPDHLLEAVPR